MTLWRSILALASSVALLMAGAPPRSQVLLCWLLKAPELVLWDLLVRWSEAALSWTCSFVSSYKWTVQVVQDTWGRLSEKEAILVPTMPTDWPRPQI